MPSQGEWRSVPSDNFLAFFHGLFGDLPHQLRMLANGHPESGDVVRDEADCGKALFQCLGELKLQGSAVATSVEPV